MEQARIHQYPRQLTGALPIAVNARWTERVLLSVALIATDVSMVLAGFWLAYTLRFEAGVDWLYQPGVAPLGFYTRLVFLLAPAWLIVFRAFGLYEFKHLFSGMREYARVFNACTLGMMLVILFSFFIPDFIIARGWLVLSWLLVTMCVFLGRFALRRFVQWLRAQGRCEGRTHRRVYRPWGHYEGLDAGDRFQVKRLTVKPGASLSLQMHHHRAEHWVVVRGTARVTRGEETFLLSEYESTYISIGVKHRLENPGKMPLEMIEVQSGSYLGEDDIQRFEDRYNRESET